MNIKITIDDEHVFKINCLLNSGISIGYANVIIDNDTAFLADIFVHDNAVIMWPDFWPIIKRKVSYRRQGIGDKLLNSVIEHCKYRKINSISGLMKGELSVLKPFYLAHGFSVNANRISMVLKHSS